jgi:3-(3-hydroxy-phenyl)propionate hydroxylase
MTSGLDVRYDLGEGQPLLGRCMPDLDLVTADGPLRVFTLLHDARPVLLNLGAPGGQDIAPWSDRVRLIDAEHAASGSFRYSGPSRSHRRVDPARGYVAWVGGRTHLGLTDALTTWFGPPTAA